MLCGLPRSLARYTSLRHEFVDVVVVRVLDAGADPSRPRSLQAGAHPSLVEVRHLDAIGEHTATEVYNRAAL